MITTAALPPTRQETVRELLATVTEHDGISPLDEAAVLALDGESAQHFLVEEAGALRGYASVLSDGTVQGMVDPAHRRRGHGTALLQEALALRPDAGSGRTALSRAPLPSSPPPGSPRAGTCSPCIATSIRPSPCPRFPPRRSRACV